VPSFHPVPPPHPRGKKRGNLLVVLELGASASSGRAGRCFWAFPGVLILVPGRFLKCFILGFSFLAFLFLAFLFLAFLFLAFSFLVLGVWAFAGKGVAGEGVACRGVASSSSGGFRVTPPVNYGWRQWRVVAGWVI
jgi:hypothetical protein